MIHIHCSKSTKILFQILTWVHFPLLKCGPLSFYKGNSVISDIFGYRIAGCIVRKCYKWFHDFCLAPPNKDGDNLPLAVVEI